MTALDKLEYLLLLCVCDGLVVSRALYVVNIPHISLLSSLNFVSGSQ